MKFVLAIPDVLATSKKLFAYLLFIYLYYVTNVTCMYYLSSLVLF